MEDFHFSYQDLINNGWDGNPKSLDKFKEQLKSMLELGWNPKEMTMQEFAVLMAVKIRNTLLGSDDNKEDFNEDVEEDFDEDNDDDENDEDDDDDDDYGKRRRRAEEMGWDEGEMDLEEFEDYYM